MSNTSSPNRIFSFHFSQEEIDLIKLHLHKLLMSRRMKGGQAFGSSCYRSDHERADESNTANVLDGITGQAGNYALIKWFFGNDAPTIYEQTRRKANESPFRGDMGSDIIGYYVDVKTSKVLAESRNNLKNKDLKIFPRERHPGVCYVKASAVLDVGWGKRSGFIEQSLIVKGIKVYLHGFIPEAQVSRNITSFYLGKKKLEAYNVSFSELIPMEELYLADWSYERRKKRA